VSKEPSHNGADVYDLAGATSEASGSSTKKEETNTLPPARPPVPEAAMYRGVLGDIVLAADPTTEADPVGVLASLLAGTGAIIGPSPHIKIGNTRHPLLVWALLFGRTGSGRKGEAGETANIFLRKTDPDSGEYTVSGLSSGEGLIERLRDDDPDSGGGNEERRKKKDPRLLVVEPEFASVMARAKREGNTLAAVLRQAWDGRALSVLNRRVLRASASHVAIIGHVTPREFRLRLAETEMAGGTYNRFLPVYVERSSRIPLPQGIPDRTLSDLAHRLATAIAAAQSITLIELTEPSRQLWCDELYDEFSAADDEDSAWTEFARRAAPYCLRIAALYAALESQQRISVNDLAAAAALVRYSVASTKYVLDRQHRDPRLDRIRRSIDAAGTQGLTRTDVFKLFSRNLSAKLLDELLEQLLTDEAYEISETRTGGRPATTYRRVHLSSFFVPEHTHGEAS
jgi:hypothetical protein